MRAISAGNRKMFTIFAVVIVLIIGVLVVGLSSVLATDKKEYTVSENSMTFDNENELIELKKEGKIYKRWDGNFYLKVGDEETLLGRQAIVYIPNRNKLTVYGTSFEVKTEGDITKVTEENEISDLDQSRFFKLEDRKYLVVGEGIKNQTGSITTQGFLIVQLDKAGNTMLTNQELSMKTIKPIILKTEDYEFDVANEKLIFGEEEIDLKKIIGSSNEYKEVKKQDDTTNTTEENKAEEVETAETEVDSLEGNMPIQNSQNNPVNPDEQTNNSNMNGQIPNNENAQNAENSNNGNISNAGNSNNGSTQNVINNNGGNAQNTGNTTNDGNTNNTGNANNAGNSQNGQIIGSDPNAGTSDKTEDSQENKTPLAKSINLRGITAKSSSLDIQYAILDPENKYQTIFLDVTGDIQKTIALDKNQRNYLITGLTPNTEYKVTLAYKEILEDNTIVDGIEDTMIVRTSKISDTLTITKIAQNKLYFNYKMDKDYVYEAGKIAFYLDGEKQEEIDIDVEKAVSSSGWTASFNYSYGNEIILKLEGATYEGKEVSRQLQAKLKMY